MDKENRLSKEEIEFKLEELNEQNQKIIENFQIKKNKYHKKHDLELEKIDNKFESENKELGKKLKEIKVKEDLIKNAVTIIDLNELKHKLEMNNRTNLANLITLMFMGLSMTTHNETRSLLLIGISIIFLITTIILTFQEGKYEEKIAKRKRGDE